MVHELGESRATQTQQLVAELLACALLTPGLLAIALCSATARSELGPVDTINGLIAGKLHGAPRASATA